MLRWVVGLLVVGGLAGLMSTVLLREPSPAEPEHDYRVAVRPITLDV